MVITNSTPNPNPPQIHRHRVVQLDVNYTQLAPQQPQGPKSPLSPQGCPGPNPKPTPNRNPNPNPN